MYAKRFHLDPKGNLHVARLFCRVLATDSALDRDADALTCLHRLDNRASKANAVMAFEEAWEACKWDEARALARRVHVVMLAQRKERERRKRHISLGETPEGHAGSQSQEQLEIKC